MHSRLFLSGYLEGAEFPPRPPVLFAEFLAVLSTLIWFDSSG
jgi:hypothetical protein